ncbi:MAG: DinB family protein [Thermoanaerobaculia bacterium]
MHPRLAGIASFLEDSRSRVVSAARAVAPENSARRPPGGGWSVDEILTHLALVEPGVAKLVEKSVRRARESGLPRETSEEPVLHLLDGRPIERVETPWTAPDFVVPREALERDTALAALVRSRETLTAAIAELDGWALAEVAAPHPILGALNMYEWLVFLGKHELRHLSQLERTAARVASGGRR